MHNCLKGTDEFPGLQQLCVRVLGCAPSLPKGGYRILASLMYACRTPPLVTFRASRFVSFRPVRGRLWAVEFKLKTSRWLESCGSLTPRAVEARDKARHPARLSGLVTPSPKAGSILIRGFPSAVAHGTRRLLYILNPKLQVPTRVTDADTRNRHVTRKTATKTN